MKDVCKTDVSEDEERRVLSEFESDRSKKENALVTTMTKIAGVLGIPVADLLEDLLKEKYSYLIACGLPRAGPFDYVAYRIDGDSMNLVYPSGSLVIIDMRTVLEPLHGKDYIISEDRAEMTRYILKRYDAQERYFYAVSSLEGVYSNILRTDETVVVGRVRRCIIDA